MEKICLNCKWCERDHDACVRTYDEKKCTVDAVAPDWSCEYFEADEEKMDKEKLIKDIEFGIQATDAEDDYSVGMRNGMRWCLSLIGGKRPVYDECKSGCGEK